MNMRAKRRSTVVWILALLPLLAGPVAAQEGTGGTRSIFALGAGSRAIAMGGAFSAAGDDASVLLYNPAALALNRYTSVLATHARLFSGWSDAGYDFLGFVYPTVSAGAFGAGFMTAGTDGIRGFDEWSRETGELTYRESQAVIAYAYTLPWRYAGAVTAGSSVKMLSQRVGDYSDTGTGVDVGFVFRPRWVEGLSLGCNLQDIVGAEIKLVSVSEPVDRTIMIGAGYARAFGNGSAVLLAAQMDAPERGDSRFRAGAEYRFRGLFAVRAGYDGESLTAGVGVGWRGFGFDYGYMSREDAGSTHPLSLSARVGSSVDDRVRRREERRLAEQERRIQQILSSRIAGHIAAAERFRVEGAPAKALDELKIALEYDPTNRAVADTIAVVERAILAAERERTRNAEKSALINQHFRLGLEYYGTGDYIRARTEWRSALEIDPENAQAAEYLGATEDKLGSLADQHRARALDLEQRGQLAAALGEWNMVRTIAPESAEANAAVQRLTARVDELSRDYLTAAKRLRVAELYEGAVKAFGEGRYPDAVRQIRELLGIDPNHAEARTLLRRAERRMTPLDDAEKAAIRSLYLEGMRHFTNGDYLKAVERWQRILEIDPDNESVLRNIEEASKRLRNSGSAGGAR
jgi:tetratricopeptide (TPR) repeat protein